MLETQRMELMIKRRKGEDVDHRGEEDDEEGGEDEEGEDVEDDNIDSEEEDVRGVEEDEMSKGSMGGDIICLLSIFTGEGTS